MSLEHALHNEKLCLKLHQENEFLDWVITTAFYSALHYSEFQLFPFTFGPHEYPDFDSWYNIFKSSKDNKHDARKRLVYSNISPIAGSSYSFIKDLCWTARYYEYKMSENDANIAIEKLRIVKGELKKLVAIG